MKKTMFGTKKRIIGTMASVAIVIAASAGVAYAFFGSTGSGSSQVTVGTAPSNAWQVSFATDPSSTVIYPGSGAGVLDVTITNTSGHSLSLTSVTAAVNANGSGDVTQSGSDVPGCAQGWFTSALAGLPALPDAVGAGDSVTGITLSVAMPNLTTVNQSACSGALPDVTVNAS